MIPILIIPELTVGTVAGSLGQALGGLPVQHAAVFGFVAILVAAWIDLSTPTPTAPDDQQWK
jgi:hypothetical protein